ncbi:Kynurenine/alpha-aminoadipate aminotransferase, mitochondrial [Auxenochlorella protothecoides]|uniref:Kynurenine/alpha-aminoadipate aminotransferase, mitochondrial n=1 Tax=Auxenochlorella protothecoides TaxID=3075 RepID=A0A087SP36_AUXPR|nr:Kynurenine/alpha-aminoadipate aminotransferase, mitochondrial [Auxenochlorella protothecoides]KFM27490.1 Kynurenine/alpha-aminoadipate aminotransferase, mitochondrial [Auxenochlorella protothecoides]
MALTRLLYLEQSIEKGLNMPAAMDTDLLPRASDEQKQAQRGATALVAGVMRQRRLLDRTLDAWLDPGVDPQLRCLLRLAVHEAERGALPDHALTHTYVELTKGILHVGAGRLVNASTTRLPRSALSPPPLSASSQTHIRAIQRHYAAKAAAVHAAAQRHLAGLADWEQPRAGMFLWITLRGIPDSARIWEAMREAKVVAVPGGALNVRAGTPGFASPAMRISFSYNTPEQVEEGLRRLAAVIRSEMGGAPA